MSGGEDQLARFPTFVPGLDEITGGGLHRGGAYLVGGLSGSGKTVLAAQICFGAAAAGERALFVTLLTESHARMLANLRSFDFFAAGEVADRIAFISGYQVLAAEGLGALFTLVREEIRRRRVTVLVLDGLALAESFAESEVDFKRFVHDLQGTALTFDCTMLLLTASERSRHHPEEAVVEGIIELRDTVVGRRTVRELRVVKLRGSGYLDGMHVFTITRAGVTVHPRFEAIAGRDASAPLASSERLPTGVADLDEMLRGGLPERSVTLLLGSPGSGKTLLSLHVVAQACAAGRRALHCGFHEGPEALVRKAAAVGLEIRRHVDEGRLHLRWQLPVEGLIDAYAETVLDDVRRHGIGCVVIDGVDGLRQWAAFPDRLGAFLTSFAGMLRTEGVTTILTAEGASLIGRDMALAVPDLSAIVDNILLLRYVEVRARLYRLLSILKIRDSDYNPSIREFSIGGDGISLLRTFNDVEAVLSGLAHERPGSADRSSPRQAD
jgi:circadian clock protein KaiC